MRVLGSRLRGARKLRRTSQTQLAKMIGTTPNQISMIENDQSGTSLRTAMAAAKALRISMDYLVGWVDEATPTRKIVFDLKRKIARIRDLEEGHAKPLDENWQEYVGINCAILVHLASREHRDGKIFVIRIEEELIVKRLVHDQFAGWLIYSDNPDKMAWPTRPWPDDAAVVGEVKWLGRTFT